MRRVLLLLVTSFALHASTFTYSSCTAGTTTETPCLGNPLLTTGLSGPNYFVSAFAHASDTPAGNISALAETTGSYVLPCLGCPPPPPLLAASAQALVNDTYLTNGPVRPGFIQLSVSITAEHVIFADDRISDGPYQYDTCPPGSSTGSEGCSGSALLPFELGIPFEMSVAAPVEPSGVLIMPGDHGEGGIAFVTLTFSLFESDGTTAVGFYPAPEPSTYGLLLCALAVCVLRRTTLSSRKKTFRPFMPTLPTASNWTRRPHIDEAQQQRHPATLTANSCRETRIRY